jgi:DNA-binding CsgD family transcriptional regulator
VTVLLERDRSTNVLRNTVPDTVAALHALLGRADRTARRPQLSHLELTVLRLVALGHTNPEIADVTGHSEGVIQTVLARRLYPKLKARGRAHAVHLGHVKGWL